MLEAVIASGLSILGLAGATEAVLNLHRARQSSWWPVVEAEVLDSGVEAHRGGAHSGASFEPTVRYQYQFGGQTFIGRRIVFASLTAASQKEAERLLEPLKPRGRVLIRVCPSAPAVSVIEPGIDRRTWLALAFFIGFTALSAAMAYRALRRAV